MQTNQIASIMDSYLNTSKCLKRWSGDYLLLTGEIIGFSSKVVSEQAHHGGARLHSHHSKRLRQGDCEFENCLGYITS